MTTVSFFRYLIPTKVFPIFCFCLFFSLIRNSALEARESGSSPKKNAPVILQLKWSHQFQFAGYYAALHKGFYQEEGLDVTIKTGGPKVKVDEEVSSGRADFGVLASELIQKKAQGQPLVLLAVIMQHSPRAIITRADSGINSPSGLVGQRMMINRNEDTELMAMFAAEGVHLNRLNIIPKDKTANNKFINGKIDALNGSIGNQPFLFQSKGIPVKIIRPISYGIDFYGDSLFTSDVELKDHPDRVEGFRRATLRGWEYAMDHPSEIIDLIVDEYNSNKTREHLQFEADAIRKIILPEIIDMGHVNPHRIERIAQTYAAHNLVPSQFSLEGFIYDPSPVSNTKFIRRLLIGFFIFVAMAVMCGVILIIFNKRLKKKVEERTKELSKSEEKFKAMAETSPLAIYMSVGKEQRAEYINPTFINFFGYTIEDVPTVNELWALAYPDENYRRKISEKWQKKVEVAIESESEIEPMDVLVTCKDGSKKNISWGFINIGQQSWAFGLNLTEQKKAEKDLRESEAHFKTIYENAPVLIDAFDKSGHCVLWNKQCRETFGWTIEEINASDDAFSLFYPDPAVRDEVLKTVTSDPDGRFREWHPVTKDGKMLTTLWANFKLADDLVFSLGHDITEQKQAEEEKEKLKNRLDQAQKMEAIGTLAGGIAHDFNNILATILGYAEMAKEDAPPGTLFEKDLKKVLIGANRAKELVKQILAFSRQAQVERIPVKIQPLVNEGLKMLRSSIPTTISITEDIDPKSGVILADPTQVYQILMNLCTNAYQAMEATSGVLSVSLKTIVIGSDEKKILAVNPGEYLELTVSDTGAGIGPDVIDKIFDPYYTTKEIGKGTGMGLAITHGIIKEYGGTITVESLLGKGTTFHVYFPVVVEDSLPEIKESENIPRGEERILFVDDEELLAEMGKTTLERLGYHVTARHSSIEALRTFQNTPNEFDMVITDQTMPEMTGSDLARRMMQIRPDIPIVLCTGYSNLIDEHSAKVLGIKEFALKPLSTAMISKIIRKVLDA